MGSFLLLAISVTNTFKKFCGLPIHSPSIICCDRLKKVFDVFHTDPFLHDALCVCVLHYYFRIYYRFICHDF